MIPSTRLKHGREKLPLASPPKIGADTPKVETIDSIIRELPADYIADCVYVLILSYVTDLEIRDR